MQIDNETDTTFTLQVQYFEDSPREYVDQPITIYKDQMIICYEGRYDTKYYEDLCKGNLLYAQMIEMNKIDELKKLSYNVILLMRGVKQDGSEALLYSVSKMEKFSQPRDELD